MTDNTINNDMTMSGAGATLIAGRYRVVKQLGQGGMGSVWLAEDTKLDGHPVAIKMLPSILVSNKRAYNQIKQEALLSLKFTHPNIAVVRAFEEERGNPFLVMDYIDGQTLDDYLAEKGKLTEEETIRILKPVAAALDYAHAQGVVHRDVKPGNVMIRKDGVPFVLDFGIAREIQETMTRVTGKLSSGTLMYMSPEQLHGEAPKPAQDVYSFSALAYECLSGHPPFERGQIEYQIDHDAPAPLAIRGGISKLILSGLAKQSERRPGSCSAVLGVSRKSSGCGWNRAKTQVTPSGRPRPWRLVMGWGVVALLGVGGWFGWSAYCRAEANRIAAIKAEIERNAAWQRLADETNRLESQVNEAQRVSEREQFVRREGLVEKVKELNDAAKSGQLAMSATNLVAATNWFHVALDNYDWLSSNAVLHVQCMQAAQEALKTRKKADDAGAKNLASNEYGRAVIEFDRADEGLKSSRFEEARSRWMKSAGLFEDAERNAVARKKAEADRVAKKVADMKRAFDGMRFDDIVRDPESEQIPELRFLKGLIYENGLGGVMPDMKRAVSLYGGTTGVCVLAEVHLARMRLSGDYLEKDKSVSVTNRIVACMSQVRGLADAGDSNAMCALYSAFDDGIGVTKDRRTGKRWLEKAVKKGNVLAKCILAANMAANSYFGDNIAEDEKDECYRMDKELYQRLFQEIRVADFWAVNFFSCMAYEFEGDSAAAESELAKCLPQIRSLAEQGVVRAQEFLGDCYKEGRGARKDLSEAFRLYQAAAEKGDVGAQVEIAKFYLQDTENTVVEKDYEQALKWIRKSIDGDSSMGMLLMGLCYQGGFGVGKDPQKALNWFLKSANEGILQAMKIVGDCYRDGVGCQTNKTEAVRWYRKAAVRGYAGAQNMLGLMYANGEGCEKDAAEAVKWYEKAVQKGNAAAMYNLCFTYISGEGCRVDKDKAFSLLRQSAARGLAAAQYRLGEAYRTGQFCAVDEREAFSWIKKAADQDYAEAQNVLGVMYASGEGCEKDAAEALGWYRKAADKGLAEAKCNLSICYRDGDGVEQNYNEAFRLMRESAMQDYPEAQNRLGILYEEGIGCAKDVFEAVRWYRKAADQNHMWGQYNLALHYRDGTGVPVDKIKAFQLMKKSADQECIDAMRELGQFYCQGIGVNKNLEEALVWFGKAAEKNDAHAENFIGVMYMDGHGVNKNSGLAKYWFDRALQHGSSWAPYNLGVLHQDGRIGPVNLVEARRLYKLAESRGCSDAAKKLAEIGR